MPNSSSATVFHLEMCDRAAFQPSAARPDFDFICVDPPNPDLNRRFYAAVGSQWQWTDRLSWSHAHWQSYVDRAELKTFIGRLNGKDVGYFELESQASGNVEIVYFGLFPKYIGQGLGGALLSAAVEEAWQLQDAKRVWVHTCSQDHDNALANYCARGFKLFKTEHET